MIISCMTSLCAQMSASCQCSNCADANISCSLRYWIQHVSFPISHPASGCVWRFAEAMNNQEEETLPSQIHFQTVLWHFLSCLLDTAEKKRRYAEYTAFLKFRNKVKQHCLSQNVDISFLLSSKPLYELCQGPIIITYNPFNVFSPWRVKSCLQQKGSFLRTPSHTYKI